jgi:hypothetical protein
MKCPKCQTSFHPQMENRWLGRNAKDVNVYLFYQIFPECKDPVVGFREQRKDELYVMSNDIKDLILLTREKS